MPPRRLAPLPAAFAALLAGCTADPPTPASGPAKASPPAQAKVGAPAPKAQAPGRTAPPPLLSAKTATPAEVDAKMARARAALGRNNVAAAYRALDELLQADPNNRQALGLMMQVAQSAARVAPRGQNAPYFLKSGEAARRLVALKAPLTREEASYLPLVLYNEACALAQTNETARALKALNDACDAGFENAAHIDTDPDLDPLRRLPAFHDFQRKLERRGVRTLLASSSPFGFDFRLPDPDGKPVALADLKGKLTVVDFWGTWCAPCRKEVPHLVELARRFGDKGLRIVGIAYESEAPDKARERVREFVREHGVTYPCLIGDDATRDQVPNFQGYPTTLFVDAKDQVRLRLVGYQSLAALEAAVETLLGDDKPQAKAASNDAPKSPGVAAVTPGPPAPSGR